MLFRHTYQISLELSITKHQENQE